MIKMCLMANFSTKAWRWEIFFFKVLTEILPDVQQDSWSPAVQLVTKRAEAEEEERSHAETITSQGEAPR